MRSVTFTVEGRPVPQGSMTASYNRTEGVAHVHHVQGAALALWRATIRKEARAAGADLSPFAAVSLNVMFGMQRPKAHMVLRGGRYIVRPKHYYDVPTVQPDLDKLIRAVSDALTGVCYRDDSQIVEIHARKRYGTFTTIEVREISTEAQDALGLEYQEAVSPETG